MNKNFRKIYWAEDKLYSYSNQIFQKFQIIISINHMKRRIMSNNSHKSISNINKSMEIRNLPKND